MDQNRREKVTKIDTEKGHIKVHKKSQNRNLWEMEREARFNSGYHFGSFRQEKEKRKEKGNEESQQQPGPPYNQNAVDV